MQKLQHYFNFLIFKKYTWKANLIGLLVFLISLSTFAESKLHHSDQWLRLLRYNKTMFGFESEVDNDHYFFSKDGKTSPKNELTSTIIAFNKSKSEFKDINQHPICLLPGRYTFLKRHKANIQDFNLDDCIEYSKYKNKLNLNSVSVIFSSFYINKPASAFGHTLLKLNSGDPMHGDLKSYGVDFSAQVTTKNPFLYGVFGIVGGFYGRFSLLPYFLKLREYNDYESRDLWEFEINFSSDEKELLVAHLWDMNLALFDYYYFSENCSYHILRLLDAIKPEWKLHDELHTFVIPVDTLVPLITKKDVVKSFYYRPSLYRRALSKYNELDGHEKDFMEKTLNSHKLDLTMLQDENQKAKLLDMLIDFVDYKYSKDIFLTSSNTDIQSFKTSILAARSQIDVTTDETPLLKQKKKTMNFAHYPRVMGLGRKGEGSKGTTFYYRSALHNVLEPDGDIYSNFSLEMNKFNFFHDEEENKTYLEKWELAHVLALRPLLLVEKKISWEFSVGIEQNPDYKERLGAFVDIAVGPTFEIGKTLLYTFASGSFSHLFSTLENKRNKVGPYIGLIHKWNRLAFQLTYENYTNLDRHEIKEDKVALSGVYSFSKHLGLSLNFERVNEEKVSKLELQYRY